MSPVGQGTTCVLAAQFYLSISLVGFTRVISFLLFRTRHQPCAVLACLFALIPSEADFNGQRPANFFQLD